MVLGIHADVGCPVALPCRVRSEIAVIATAKLYLVGPPAGQLAAMKAEEGKRPDEACGVIHGNDRGKMEQFPRFGEIVMQRPSIAADEDGAALSWKITRH